jgi:transcriptional regulator with XRE-family HTH domain
MELIKLKELRQMRKKSIKQLSAETGINRDRLSRIERGKVNPSWKYVELIAKALNAEIELRITI